MDRYMGPGSQVLLSTCVLSASELQLCQFAPELRRAERFWAESLTMKQREMVTGKRERSNSLLFSGNLPKDLY